MSHSDAVSDCSSYSYSPEYRNFIEEDGSCFYIIANPIDHSKSPNNAQNNQDTFSKEFSRMSLRKRERGILSKLTGKKKPVCDLKVVDSNKYEHADGILKELKIRNGKKMIKPKHGDKRTFFEIMFNATIILSPDNKRLMIDSINNPSEISKYLKIGDYIKSIDGEILTVENTNNLLTKAQNQKSFKIVAEESFRDELESTHEEIKMTKISDVVEQKEKLFQLEAESHELVFSLNIIVKNEQINEDSGDFTTVFSFPPQENNFLHKLKGAFLTIASLIKSTHDTHPSSTDIKVHNTTFHITYVIRNGDNEYIFLGFNSNYAQLFDAEKLTKNFVATLDYIYPNLLIINEFDQLNAFCEMMKIQLVKKALACVDFEKHFPLSKFVSLPKEIVLRGRNQRSKIL